MGYLILISAVFLFSSETLIGGFYQRKNNGSLTASSLYNLLEIGTACLCWGILYIRRFETTPKVLLYSLIFGVCFALTNIGIINAVKCGPVSLTALMLNFSMIGASIWGLLFWSSPITWKVVAGLIFVVVSLFFCTYNKAENGHKTSLKWLLFAMLVFIGNAGCSITQRDQQLRFLCRYAESFMFFAMAFATVICLLLHTRNRKAEETPSPKTFRFLPISAGIFNTLLNAAVIALVKTDLSTNLIYPVIAVGGIGLNLIVSLFVFKETLSKRQWIGMGLGIVAVTLLSIS